MRGVEDRARVVRGRNTRKKSHTCNSGCRRIATGRGLAPGEVSEEGQMKDPATGTGSGTCTDALELGGERASISNGEQCGSYPTR